MRVRFTTAAIAAALVSAGASACAVSAGGVDPIGCTVVDGAKLSAVAGGADAICEAVRRAAAEQGIEAAFAVEIRVLSPSLLVANVTTADGRRLPGQRLVSADREIGRSALQRFARSIVAEIRSDRG